MSMAELIAQRRKEAGMTQRQLADKLGVTDKAVSKWERGNGQPDINYLEPLAGALDISVSELLKGKMEQTAIAAEDEGQPDERIEKKVPKQRRRSEKARTRDWRSIASISILILGLTGIITVSIVDFALNRSFTWSLLPISAIVYFWLCTIPLLSFKKHGGDIALLSMSIFLFPFLNIVSHLVGGNWFGSIAIPMSISGLAILWLIRAVFAVKISIWNKLAISALIAAAGNGVIAYQLGNILGDGGFDVWNLMSVVILVVLAIILFSISVSVNRAKKGR